MHTKIRQSTRSLVLYPHFGPQIIAVCVNNGYKTAIHSSGAKTRCLRRWSWSLSWPVEPAARYFGAGATRGAQSEPPRAAAMRAKIGPISILFLHPKLAPASN